MVLWGKMFNLWCNAKKNEKEVYEYFWRPSHRIDFSKDVVGHGV